MDINEKKAKVFDLMREMEKLQLESQKLQREIIEEENKPKGS